jgi:hypothetical protein
MPTISKKTDKSITNQTPQQIQEILKNDYLEFFDCGNLVGYQQFGDKWDFNQITDYYTRELPFFNTYYYNNIHFSHLKNPYGELFDVQPLQMRTVRYRGQQFAYLAHFIAYTLFLNAVAEQKGFENIRLIPDDYIKEINDKFFDFGNGHFLFFDGRMLDLKGLSGIDNRLLEFIKKLIKMDGYDDLGVPYSYNECRLPFLNIEKSSVKNLYDLIAEYTGDLNDPLKRKIRNFIQDKFGEKCIPETIDAIHSLNDLFEYQYERIERFIKVKGLIYQGLRNGRLELFERLKNGGYQRLEEFSESALKQEHEFFDGEIDGKKIYISRDSAIKFVESRKDIKDVNVEVGLNDLVSSQDAVKTNQKSVDDVELWKKFIEDNLNGNFNKADIGYAMQAASAYNRKTQKENLKYFDVKKKCFKKTVITTDLLSLAKKYRIAIGKTSINKYITLPFVEKLSNHSNH